MIDQHLTTAFDYAIARNRVLVISDHDSWSYVDERQATLTAVNNNNH